MNCSHNQIHAAIIVELLFLCFMDRVRKSAVHSAFMSVRFMPLFAFSNCSVVVGSLNTPHSICTIVLRS